MYVADGYHLVRLSAVATMATLTLVHGWILSKRAFGDTSVILDILTPEQGRLSVLSKGGRKNALLQPFQPLLISFAGRGELPYLRHSEANGRALSLRGDALWCAFYLNELLTRLLFPGVAVSPSLFRQYGNTICTLEETNKLQPPLRQFEWELLQECGYAFDLGADTSGHPLQPEACYQVSQEGLMMAAQGLAGQSILAWQQGQWNADIARTSKLLMRTALLPYIGSRPLKTPQLFRSMKNRQTPVGERGENGTHIVRR